MYNLKSKAQTLLKLHKKKLINIPKTFIFNVENYKKNKIYIINKIQKLFSNKIAIRSSNVFEDTNNKSFAGKFKSVLNVNPNNNLELINSIEDVINSYKNFRNDKNEILIQNMIKNVSFSGVCTTCDLENYFPFYQINYSIGKDTTVVTSGKS